VGAIAYIIDFDDFVELTRGVERYYCIRTKEMGREITLHLLCTARKGDTVYVYEEISIVEHAKEYSEKIKYFRMKIMEKMPDAKVGFIAFDIQQLVDALGFGESVASFLSREGY